MCGRYALTVEPDVLAALFALDALEGISPRFNMAPSQLAPVIVRGEGDSRSVQHLAWGLVPPWAKDSKIGYRTINARSETAHEKPSFRSAFKKRRCIVPASWFYEWESDGGQKLPWRIQRTDGAPLAFAGLHEHWRGTASEAPRSTFTILTTGSNADLEHLHHRMPCILEVDGFDRWLQTELDDPAATARLLEPAPPGTLVLDRVSTRLNNARNEGPDLLTPDTLF